MTAVPLGARPEVETEMRIQKERAKRRALPSWLRIAVGDVPAAPPILLQPSTLAVQALRRLRETNSTAALVVNAEDRLLGIVTLTDLAFETYPSISTPIWTVERGKPGYARQFRRPAASSARPDAPSTSPPCKTCSAPFSPDATCVRCSGPTTCE